MFTKTTVTRSRYWSNTETDERYPSMFEFTNKALKNRLGSSDNFWDSIQRFWDEVSEIIWERKNNKAWYEKFKRLLGNNANMQVFLDYFSINTYNRIQELNDNIKLFVLAALKNIPEDAVHYNQAQHILWVFYITAWQSIASRDSNNDDILARKAIEMKKWISYLMNSQSWESFKALEELWSNIWKYFNAWIKERNWRRIIKFTNIGLRNNDNSASFTLDLDDLQQLVVKADYLHFERNYSRDTFMRSERDYDRLTEISYIKTHLHLIWEMIAWISEAIPHIHPFMIFYEVVKNIGWYIPQHYMNQIERNKKRLEQQSWNPQ